MTSFYRRARIDEIDEIMEAVEDSRAILKEQGNGQWQDGYPCREDFERDIRNCRLFAVVDRENPSVLVGVAAFTYYEEDYDHLYEGAWHSDLPYMVMHRVALKAAYRGQGYGKDLFEAFIQQAKKEGYRSLRIDTHEGNDVMRHLISRAGFEYCGKAILPPNKDRMVFEKILQENEVSHRILESDRIYLRKLNEADMPDLKQMYQDPENMKYYPAPYDEARMRRLLEWTDDNYRILGFGFYAIIDKSSGAFVGDCGLSMQNIDGELLPEIGYHLKPRYHHQGYATEAARLVKEFGFREFGFEALYGYATKENQPSLNVMIRNGMEFVKEYGEGNDIHVVYRVLRSKGN